MKSTTIALSLLLGHSAISLAKEEFNAVDHGRKTFESAGCNVCHAVDPDDKSDKTGPSLYNLFVTEPHEVEVHDPKTNRRKTILHDEAYFKRSIRNSTADLAIALKGPFAGNPYPPMMPPFAPEAVSDTDLESLWHYIRTLAEPGKSGPAVVMIKKQTGKAETRLVDIEGEIPVDQRTRVFRARVKGLSGRGLFVGQPNHLNYAFDPRFLSLRSVWTGGYLNLAQERKGRGGEASTRGHMARVALEGEPLLTPLTSDGQLVDFEFKEPDVGDEGAIIRHLYDDTHFLTKLHQLDAEFLGHTLSPDSGNPTFRFRVGKNQFEQTIHILDDGMLTIHLRAHTPTSQSFKLRPVGTPQITGNGTFDNNTWTLPASSEWTIHTLSLKLDLDIPTMLPVGSAENLQAQPLTITAKNEGKLPARFPKGYHLKTWQTPKDIFGGKLLFEPTGIDLAKDGTIVLATRAAGVWRIRNGEWSLFAEGTFECLGVCIEDDKGDRVVITQKPELTRLADTDGDGRADRFETVCDDYGFHADYHEYTHGPTRDSDGNYYFNLNLAHNPKSKSSWKGGSGCMGSMGGYRGWACRVTPQGTFEPFAGGLRSSAGIACGPDGRIWYAENQGDYVGSSTLVPLEKDQFYGHVASMVSLPGKTPDSPDLTHELWKDKLRKGAVWFPHGRLANSPGHPVWDKTGGKFGVYQDQIFIADQTMSAVMRVVTEQVNGIDQGCTIPFGEGLASGGMRPCFLPDGSLLIGQTGRGWGSKGGLQYALQQIVWDGSAAAADILKVTTTSHGFDVHFTTPIATAIDPADTLNHLRIQSWTYISSPKYGSPEAEFRDDAIGQTIISQDRKTLSIHLKDFGKNTGWIDRIYHLKFSKAAGLFTNETASADLQAYVTLRAIPDSSQASR